QAPALGCHRRLAHGHRRGSRDGAQSPRRLRDREQGHRLAHRRGSQRRRHRSRLGGTRGGRARRARVHDLDWTAAWHGRPGAARADRERDRRVRLHRREPSGARDELSRPPRQARALRGREPRDQSRAVLVGSLARVDLLVRRHPASRHAAAEASGMDGLFEFFRDHLARLHWAWALLGLPLAIGAYVWGHKRRQRALASLGRPEMVARLIATVSPGARLVKAVTASLALLGISIALLRPQHGGVAKVVPSRGLDIVVAVDYSKSMLVDDVYPSRSERLEA